MDIQKYGQSYPTFQTSQYFTQAQDQKDTQDSKEQIQILKLSQELDPSMMPITQYEYSLPFQIDSSVINKIDHDSNSNILQRASDLQNAYMMLDNTNLNYDNTNTIAIQENTPNPTHQILSSLPKGKDENKETLKQLREFLVDQIEDVSLNDIYKNYELLTNYCLKQQFLLQNKHFDPKQYFQGRKINNEDLHDKKVQPQTFTQKVLIKPQQISQSQQQLRKNSNPKQREVVQLDFVKEESYSGSATPHSPNGNNNIIGSFAKYPQAITPIKKNSQNISSASTKLGFQPSSGANSYINNSNQDISRSLLQSKNLMIQGSSQNIHNFQDISGTHFKDEGNISKGENINTQNFAQPLRDNKDIKKDIKPQIQVKKNQYYSQPNQIQNGSQYSPKSKLEQQITLFEASGGNNKNKNYIQYIRDYQNNPKSDQIKNYSGLSNNGKQSASTSNLMGNSPTMVQNPSSSILKNVQINLFTNKGIVNTSTDTFKKQENTQLSSNRLRSSNNTVSPKNSQTDPMKNSFTKKEKQFSILKQSDNVTSPLQTPTQTNTIKKGAIVNLSLNSRLSPKNSNSSGRTQPQQFNSSAEKDKIIQSNRGSSVNQSVLLQKQENARKQQLSQEKARKSISIHLDQTKFYQYNTQQPVSNSENKTYKSIDLKNNSTSKLQQQPSSSSNATSQLMKDQIKLSNEISRLNKLLEFNKQQMNTGTTEQTSNNTLSLQNSIQSPVANYPASAKPLYQDMTQNKENKSVNKKQQHYTIPLIKALNLSKVSSQANIINAGEDNGSQREIKEYATQSVANSRTVSPSNPGIRERKMASPGSSLNNSKGRLSSSLQPTPRDHPEQQKMHTSIINESHQQVAKNIASVISILNKKVKKESQSQATLRAINQILSVKKTPLSPSQRSLSRGQTNIGTPLPSGYQNQVESTGKHSSQVMINNFSTQQIPSAQSSQKNIINSPAQGTIFQPQLNQKYTEIYQQMAQLNQKFNHTINNQQQIIPAAQGYSQSNTNSNNASQIFLNQPVIFSQTTLGNSRNASKNNIRVPRKNIQ